MRCVDHYSEFSFNFYDVGSLIYFTYFVLFPEPRADAWKD
jgi:hypothetical protein